MNKKYVSTDILSLEFSKSTEKAIQFLNHPQSYTGEIITIWIPKSLIDIAYNNEDDYIFIIPSWYYFKEINGKLNYEYASIKHGTKAEFKKHYEHIVSSKDVEL